jgi:hypothetical protein
MHEGRSTVHLDGGRAPEPDEGCDFSDPRRAARSRSRPRTSVNRGMPGPGRPDVAGCRRMTLDDPGCPWMTLDDPGRHASGAVRRAQWCCERGGVKGRRGGRPGAAAVPSSAGPRDNPDLPGGGERAEFHGSGLHPANLLLPRTRNPCVLPTAS